MAYENTPTNDGFALVAEADGTIPIQAVRVPGSQIKPLADGYGRLYVNAVPFEPTYPVQHQTTGGTAAAITQLSISAVPCRLVVLSGYNADTANDLFVQLHNLAGGITVLDVPFQIIPVPKGQPFSYSIPLVFTVGLAIGISTTAYAFNGTAQLASVAGIYDAAT